MTLGVFCSISRVRAVPLKLQTHQVSTNTGLENGTNSSLVLLMENTQDELHHMFLLPENLNGFLVSAFIVLIFLLLCFSSWVSWSFCFSQFHSIMCASWSCSLWTVHSSFNLQCSMVSFCNAIVSFCSSTYCAMSSCCSLTSKMASSCYCWSC